MTRDLLGMVLLIIQTGLLVPLCIELLRSRSSKGISLLGETIWVSAGIGWMLYGVSTANKVIIASGCIAAVGSAMVTALILRDTSRSSRLTAFMVAGVALVAFLASRAVWGSVGLAVTLSAFGVIQFIPQIVTSVRSLVNQDGHGVPLVGSLLRSVYTLSWAVYAGAWFLWGMVGESIDFPLVVWGLAGAVAFGLQFCSGLRAKRCDKIIADKEGES